MLLLVSGYDDVSGQVHDAATPARVITASAQDRVLGWRIERLWQIDGSGQDGLLLSMLNPGDVDAHHSVGIAVLDRMARRVYLISAAGAVTDSVGREGRGPGELSRPANVVFDADGNIAVMDRGKAAFVRWRGNDRQLLDQFPATGIFFGSVALVRGGYAYRDLATETDGVRYRLMRHTEGEPRQLAIGPLLGAREAEFPTCAARLFGAPWLSPRLMWAAREDRIVVVPDHTYSFDVFETGAADFRVQRPLAPRRMTRALALREVVDERVGSCRIPPEEAVRGFGFAAHLPLINDVAIAPNGEIWVKRGTLRGEHQLIDIFSSGGQYIGTLADAPFPAAFVDSDVIIAVSADQLDVPRLTAYRVTR